MEIRQKGYLIARIILTIFLTAAFAVLFVFAVGNFEQSKMIFPLWLIILFYIFAVVFFLFGLICIVLPKQTVGVLYQIGQFVNVFNFGFKGVDTRESKGSGCFFIISIIISFFACFVFLALLAFLK